MFFTSLSSSLSTQVAAEPQLDHAQPIGYFQQLIQDAYLPYLAIIFSLLCVLFLIYKKRYAAAFQMKSSAEGLSKAEAFDNEEKLVNAGIGKRVLLYIIPLLVIGYLIYIGIRGTSMMGFVTEWLNLIVRWVHVIAGIMWIGASFYFIFLENSLNRTLGIRDELAGNLWAIHGGGFYFLEKYKVAPKTIPKELHWFKYEAYFTWISGFTLLCIVYYMDAKAFLIDPSIADISVGAAIAIGIGSLVVGWVLYDLLCKSVLVKKPIGFAVVSFVLLTAFSYFLTHVFSPRAAFIHVGALIGTIMAANVFFVIIPSQKALVKAAVTGQPLDPNLGKRAGLRSLHNNYTTLPVIFIMISNHFPSTFGHSYSWIVLMVITLASASIKHYWNLLERGVKKTYILIASLVLLIGLIVATSPLLKSAAGTGESVAFSTVNDIFQKRCVQCHSAAPTDDQWTAAPNGVMYDTPDQIKNMSDKIMIRAVTTHTMPLGNKTGMTDGEREIVGRWIQQGAIISQ